MPVRYSPARGGCSFPSFLPSLTQARFNAAAEQSKTLKSPSNDDLLALYKYFKQVR